MTDKTFRNLVSEAIDAIQRQRQEDRNIYDRLCNKIVRYEGRNRDFHDLRQDAGNLSADLTLRDKAVTTFTVSGGKVQIGQEHFSEADALVRLAEMTAKTAIEIDDEREQRRKAAAA